MTDHRGGPESSQELRRVLEHAEAHRRPVSRRSVDVAAVVDPDAPLGCGSPRQGRERHRSLTRRTEPTAVRPLFGTATSWRLDVGSHHPSTLRFPATAGQVRAGTALPAIPTYW